MFNVNMSFSGHLFPFRYLKAVVYIFQVLCLLFFQSHGQTEADLGPCYSLKSLMDLFNRPEYISLPAVHALMEAYNTNCEILVRKNPSPKAMLLIVVEGTKRRKRFIIANKLARAIKGHILINPPEGFERMRFSMNFSMELKRAYHSLCLYATANRARQYLAMNHVIISGYWFDQAAFVIVKKYYPNFPQPSSPLWKWPKDLLVPDLTFYIDDSEPPSFRRKNDNNIAEQMREVYKRWSYPKVVPILNTTNYNVILREMIAHIDMYQHRLAKEPL
uniref:Uncharacterized protein n=1 Tax=Clastoptera arizonana TaxID=38151 RepID=A0A1B6CQT9_9HEMI